jgi:hypothetical protein
LALKLRDMEAISRATTGTDVRRLFVERSGMLREPIPGHIDFTHVRFSNSLRRRRLWTEGTSEFW